MSRTDIIKELVDRTGMDIQQVTDFCDTLVDIFTDSLLENKKVSYQIKDDIYKDILRHIYVLCKGYEQHESIYKGKHEESLRDLIVPSLNSISIISFFLTFLTELITFPLHLDIL